MCVGGGGYVCVRASAFMECACVYRCHHQKQHMFLGSDPGPELFEMRCLCGKIYY